jgi:hypothetical protein
MEHGILNELPVETDAPQDVIKNLALCLLHSGGRILQLQVSDEARRQHQHQHQHQQQQ